jgi:hypothetical protein
MTHPLFSDDSTCLNCAAFVPDEPTHAGNVTSGSCHRYAPRPFSSWTKRDVAEEGESVDEPSREVSFPQMDDVMFCCEWLPKVPAPKTETDR